DIYRHRKQHGVNLGSWFVLERWITESPFRSAASPGQSDLDVARGSNAKEILEHHWDTWITRADWEWLTQNGINTVRIPIGYYHLCGVDASVLNSTDFADFQDVFEGAWSRITNAISTANEFNIGVLLVDLHSAPGKQNRDSHSGTSAPTPAFFSHHNMTHTTHILSVLARNLPSLPNIVGIELLNEPQPDSKDDALKRWYADTIPAIRDAAPSMPVYISDCWRTDDYAGFIAALAKSPPKLDFVVLDHHLYRCFTGGDVSTPVEQHAKALKDASAGTFARVSQNLQFAGGAMIVGEWSGALNPGSLAHLSGGAAEMKARRAYLKAEVDLFERYCAGWFFWTYKKEGRDVGWAFRDAVEAGIWPAGSCGLVVRNECERDAGRSGRRNTAMDRALVAGHVSYWDQYPGKYEHFRFGEGFAQGWDDAYEHFLCTEAGAGKGEGGPVPELGFKGPWAKRRAEAYVRNKGGADHVWEYEHGVIAGIDAARRDFVEVYCE
ncbi:glycoside hydrolase family 5 protein, partial [Neolentinus lepideus HHB14362 ss-1]